jgi:hypothetical protein
MRKKGRLRKVSARVKFDSVKCHNNKIYFVIYLYELPRAAPYEETSHSHKQFILIKSFIFISYDTPFDIRNIRTFSPFLNMTKRRACEYNFYIHLSFFTF